MDDASQDAYFDDLERLTNMNILGNRFPIKKIALPADYWYQEFCRENLDLMMDSLKSLQTEELILIVENNFAHQYTDDIAFVQARGSSLDDVPYFESWDVDIRSWDDAEAAEMRTLRDLQAERAAEREAYWLSNTQFILWRSSADTLLASGIADEDDVDYEKADLDDFSGWTVKRIRFMEATTVKALRKISRKASWVR